MERHRNTIEDVGLLVTHGNFHLTERCETTMNEYQHSQTTTEIAAQAMRDKVNGANSRCSPPHGSAGALRADMLDLAMHCEKRAKTLDDMVKTAASAELVRLKTKAGVYRSIAGEIKQRLRSHNITLRNIE